MMTFSKGSRRKKPVAVPAQVDSGGPPDSSTGEKVEVTQVLDEWSEGDPGALHRLMPLVSEALREIAGRFMAKENPRHTLQPTALVNEVYLRLVGQRTVSFKNRAHFYGFAAELMRRILVESARKRLAEMRGKGERPVSIDTLGDLPGVENAGLLELHEALLDLEKVDPRAGRVTVLHFFGGLTYEEIAEALEISETTVKRDWQTARLWLLRELGDPKK